MWRDALISLPVVACAAFGQEGSLDSVLARAADYLAALRQKAPIILADETYVQILRPYGSTNKDRMASGALLGQMGDPKSRKLKADFAFVAPPASVDWQAFRDVGEVDGKRMREPVNRLERAVAGLPPDWTQARQVTSASLRYDMSTTPHDVNVPTFPLTFLAHERQTGCTFRKKGEKSVDGVKAWVIEFSETGTPIATLLDGTPQPSRGELWIDPATGHVLRTHVVFDSIDAFPDMKAHPERYRDSPRVTIDVVYRRDARLDLWLPSEMKELYDRRDEVVNTTATYSNFRLPKQ